MLKLLIADDEQLIRESLACCVDWGGLGIEVVGCCKNGVEALDAIIDASPDLMITDIRMPGLTGLELIEKIHARDREIQVIILSGYREFEYAKQAIRFGVTDYLLKPVNEKSLIEAVEKAKDRCDEKLRLKRVPPDEGTEHYEVSSAMILRLKDYVSEHLSESGLTLKWIAEHVLFMNVDYVSRKFSTETGEKFSAFLTRTRMERAKQLLPRYGKDGLSQVASLVGCGNSQRYFGQLFKKHTGMTPTQYLNGNRSR